MLQKNRWKNKFIDSELTRKLKMCRKYLEKMNNKFFLEFLPNKWTTLSELQITNRIAQKFHQLSAK